jgi:hypothetical protein
MQLECDLLGVIDFCDASDWIEECSVLGSLVALEDIENDSMLIFSTI